MTYLEEISSFYEWTTLISYVFICSQQDFKRHLRDKAPWECALSNIDVTGAADATVSAEGANCGTGATSFDEISSPQRIQ